MYDNAHITFISKVEVFKYIIHNLYFINKLCYILRIKNINYYILFSNAFLYNLCVLIHLYKLYYIDVFYLNQYILHINSIYLPCIFVSLIILSVKMLIIVSVKMLIILSVKMLIIVSVKMLIIVSVKMLIIGQLRCLLLIFHAFQYLNTV